MTLKVILCEIITVRSWLLVQLITYTGWQIYARFGAPHLADTKPAPHLLYLHMQVCTSLDITSLAVSPDIYALYIKYGSIACNVMGDHVGGIHVYTNILIIFH
jgi:hypothetical protein